MNNKKYPTRMHEVLGVETNERFRIAGYSRSEEFYLLGNGTLTTDRVVCYQGVLVEIINHPERIVRTPPKPRLSEEQVKQLRALVTLGYRWLIKDSTDAVFAYAKMPAKQSEWWNCGGANVRIFIDLPPGILTSLVYWSDPDPLDIVATLKANGVEVEG